MKNLRWSWYDRLKSTALLIAIGFIIYLIFDLNIWMLIGFAAGSIVYQIIDHVVSYYKDKWKKKE